MKNLSLVRRLTIALLVAIFALSPSTYCLAAEETTVAEETESSDETSDESSDESAETEATTQTDSFVSLAESRTDLLNEDQSSLPEITSTAYVLYDAQSGAILAGENYNERMEPASTTKVMTVMIAMQELEMTDMVTITPEMAAEFEKITGDYVKLGLQEGEEMSVKDLIYAAILKSANDATLALAMYISGTEDAFCEKMNEKAAEIGCLNTTFTSAYGLSKSTNLVTAYDLALILNEAINTTDYSQISMTYSYTIAATNKYSEARELTNANRFISTTEYAYDYYIGGKTGFTDTAGYTMCAAASKNGRTLVGTVLNSTTQTSRYSDLIKLFEYGYNYFTTVEIDPTEFSSLISETNARIDDLLSTTSLYVSDEEVTYTDYITTTSKRAETGSTNKVDLSDIVIDTSLNEQTLSIPVCKVYADKTYMVGEIKIIINQKAGIVEINPAKRTGLTSLRAILITVAVLAALVLILIVSIVIFRKQLRKKKLEESNRRPKVL